MECDTLLVCIGRKPYTEGLGLEVCLDLITLVVYNCVCFHSNWVLLLIKGDVFQSMDDFRHPLTSIFNMYNWYLLNYMPYCITVPSL